MPFPTEFGVFFVYLQPILAATGGSQPRSTQGADSDLPSILSGTCAVFVRYLSGSEPNK